MNTKSRRLTKAQEKVQATEARARASEMVAEAARAEFETLNEAAERDFPGSTDPFRPWAKSIDTIAFLNSSASLTWAKAQQREETMRKLAEMDKQTAADAAKELKAAEVAEAAGGGWWQHLFRRKKGL